MPHNSKIINVTNEGILIMQTSQDEIKALKEEIVRLRELLIANGIPFQKSHEFETTSIKQGNKLIYSSNLSLIEKVTLFQSLFKGREDIFARRWYSNKTGKSGYQPVCLNEWNPELCNKPKYKCSDCPNRKLKPLDYDDYYRHLEGKDPCGKDVIGVYAILPDDTCNFLCCDFDDKDCVHGFQEDVRAYIEVCKDWNIQAYIEKSRSGNGAHVWILFEEPIKASIARKLGNTILTEAMERTGKISFKSYDRFFPNQDTMPNGGFGNLVALPLQGQARKKGTSVFVDENFEPYSDQWKFLQNVKKLDKLTIDSLLLKYGKQNDMGSFSKSSESEPWERPISKPLTSLDFPAEIKIVKESGIYIPLKGLSGKVINHLKRIAAFRNPDFFAKMGMRLPVFNTPRVISCSELLDDYLLIPRGCEESVLEFFERNNVNVELVDKSNHGLTIEVSFKGELYPEQQEALETLLRFDCGTLHASTAFGKTVTAAAMIAEKKVNTLILVHNKSLLQQWRNRLNEFLDIDFKPDETTKGRGRRKKFQQFGGLSSDETTLNGKIDIALIQSCIESNEVKPFIRNYGMVIVDECHHVPAVSFENVLKGINAKYVYGLTATPIRKDGHQPIIFMYCGEIRHKGERKPSNELDNFERLLIPRFTGHRNFETKENSFNLILEKLSNDEARNKLILEDVAVNLREGRTPLILTDRIDHVDLLTEQCQSLCPNVIKLVGKVPAKEKNLQLERLNSIPSDEQLVIVATRKYIGEGFDFARLDTLMLATPFSWKGRLNQYAGRLHRIYPGKKQVRIYDYIDLRVPVLESMYRKRLTGYKSIDYKIGEVKTGLFQDYSPQTIYTADDFEKTFHDDLSNSRKNILIAVKRLRWNKIPPIIHLLIAQLHEGIGIIIVVQEIGYNENDLSSIGFNIVHNPEHKLNCAVIDNKLTWYGDINLIGKSLADSSIVRLESSELISSIYESLNI